MRTYLEKLQETSIVHLKDMIMRRKCQIEIDRRDLVLMERVLAEKSPWRRCKYAEAQQHRSRVLTGSIGLEGPWSEWIDGKPDSEDMNREYEYRTTK